MMVRDLQHPGFMYVLALSNTLIQESFISHGLTQAECEAEGLFTIIAGSESTAAAIRSVLVHTISCPRAYMKVKAEIRETLNSGSVASPISSEQVNGLSYLQVYALAHSLPYTFPS